MAAPVGFCGLGIMGTAMARNLLKGGHPVVVYNRTAEKCAELVSEGATQALTAKAVVEQCGITIGMVSDPKAALALAMGPEGVVSGITAGKGYVDMSTVDADTSLAIADAVTKAGGRFLEAPVSGSKGPAIKGELVILAAGDKSLYDDAAPLFEIMGKKRLHLGDVGRGAHMKLVVNMVMGSMQTAFSEGMGLAKQTGLSVEDYLDVVGAGAMNCPMFQLKGPLMNKGEYGPAFPLKHAQKDMRLALALGDSVNQPMPVAAAANEVFKTAIAMDHGDHDFSAVHLATTRNSGA
jgi:3-hydroxyisobutyrate dehydrogenase-like beta-hydroxyacid dehydrogenase